MNRLLVTIAVLNASDRGQTWATNNKQTGFLDLTQHWTNTTRNIGLIMESELNLNGIRTMKISSQNMAINTAFLTEQDSSEHRGLTSHYEQLSLRP